jgi:hypothetical protein
MISERHLNCRRFVYFKIPLFINYLFLRIPEDGQWYKARRAAGVCDFLMDHVGPARIADSIVEGLMASERAGSSSCQTRQILRSIRPCESPGAHSPHK